MPAAARAVPGGMARAQRAPRARLARARNRFSRPRGRDGVRASVVLVAIVAAALVGGCIKPEDSDPGATPTPGPGSTPVATPVGTPVGTPTPSPSPTPGPDGTRGP